MNPYMLICLFYSLFPSFHGDLDIRIEEATTAIKTDQSNDSLYVIRGTLYYQHQEYLKSIRDFEKVESLVGPSEIVYMSYARAWHKLENFDFAIENVDLTLKTNNKNSVAYRLKALILMDMKQYDKAAENFDLSLTHTNKLITESFLEIAIALDSAGTTESLEKSIHILNRGRAELADLDIFKNMIVDQYTKLGDYESAIHLQSNIIDAAHRKERHYFKRAKLHLLRNNPAEAQEDIQHAFDAISRLPARYIRSIPMDTLRKHLIELSQIIKSE